MGVGGRAQDQAHPVDGRDGPPTVALDYHPASTHVAPKPIAADAPRRSRARARLRAAARRVGAIQSPRGGHDMDREPHTRWTPRSGGHVDELRLDALRTSRRRRAVSARSGGEHRRLAGAGQSEEPSTAIDGRGSTERESPAEAGGDQGERRDARSVFEFARTLRAVGTMHHARRALIDDAQRATTTAIRSSRRATSSSFTPK